MHNILVWLKYRSSRHCMTNFQILQSITQWCFKSPPGGAHPTKYIHGSFGQMSREDKINSSKIHIIDQKTAFWRPQNRQCGKNKLYSILVCLPHRVNEAMIWLSHPKKGKFKLSSCHLYVSGIILDNCTIFWLYTLKDHVKLRLKNSTLSLNLYVDMQLPFVSTF